MQLTPLNPLNPLENKQNKIQQLVVHAHKEIYKEDKLLLAS